MPYYLSERSILYTARGHTVRYMYNFNMAEGSTCATLSKRTNTGSLIAYHSMKSTWLLLRTVKSSTHTKVREYSKWCSQNKTVRGHIIKTNVIVRARRRVAPRRGAHDKAFEFKPELSAVVNKINFTWRWFTSLGASVYESPSQNPPPASET